jgi:hypothetical protein
LQQSLKKPEAQGIIRDMSGDLQSLANAMETHIGP